ncbi:BatD family protein [Pseudoxanthomonas suwonensis]|uniref:BatD family protein n=1 Tax=Pseudoxanthomonas suwonensis TaxID=314722 RepID=UPI0012DED5CB|nr:BatD family protein [Pseudoxanthomonas suwonensis]
MQVPTRSRPTIAGQPHLLARRLLAWASLLLLACLPASVALAETRAWLDRESAAMGDAVTLNIETDQPGVAPDYRPLAAAFELGQPYRSDRNGRTLFGIALTPRRTGALDVPALAVGRERTAPLRLQVGGAPAPAPRGDAFVEVVVDDPAPYVQQGVGLVVRLHYATPLLSGELVLDAPDGASLQRVGDDVQSSREVGGRRYHVVERRYLLVPERSGPLVLPPARFRGRAAANFFDDFFGGGGGRRELSAQSPPQTLQVHAQPAGAPQPWLPLRELRLRYLAAPTAARAGEAVEIAVEAVARGVTAAQFPDLPVPRVDGAQVFPERAETTERFIDGSPQLTVVRRYAVVPLAPGRLRVAGPRIDWWNVRERRAEAAMLPELAMEVAPGNPEATPAGGGTAAQARSDATAVDAMTTHPVSAGNRLWPWLALALAVLWLATLAWALSMRRRRAHAAGEGAVAGVLRSRPVALDLQRVLDGGSFDEVVRVLQRMADPPAADLDALLARLDDPRQREALEAMRRALWAGDGDASAARVALRSAFRGGPRWKATATAPREPLPPLYPER